MEVEVDGTVVRVTVGSVNFPCSKSFLLSATTCGTQPVMSSVLGWASLLGIAGCSDSQRRLRKHSCFAFIGGDLASSETSFTVTLVVVSSLLPPTLSLIAVVSLTAALLRRALKS